MNSKIAYLASPYSDVDPAIREARFDAVCRFAARLMSEGWFVFSPIAHTHPIAIRGELPTDWQYWQEFDKAMIAACGMMIVLKLGGWEQSRGVKAEIEIAMAMGMKIEYVEPR